MRKAEESGRPGPAELPHPPRLVKSELNLYIKPKLLSGFHYYYSGFSELLSDIPGNVFTPLHRGHRAREVGQLSGVTQPGRASW